MTFTGVSPYVPLIGNISEQFRNETVVVILDLTTQNDDLTFYTVNVFPQATITYNNNIIIVGRLQAEFVYNILYNLSITSSLCGQNLSFLFQLHYGESMNVQDCELH